MDLSNIWSSSTCSCEKGEYLASIMNHSAIICDEVIESYDKERKTIPRNFNEKKGICKTQNFYILLAFLLITIAFLIAISIYCYLIKYYFFNEIIYIENFDPDNIKIDEKSYKNVFMYCIGYVTIK